MHRPSNPPIDILRSETFTTMPTQMRSLLQDEMEHEKIRYVLNLNTARNVMIDAGVVCAH